MPGAHGGFLAGREEGSSGARRGLPPLADLLWAASLGVYRRCTRLKAREAALTCLGWSLRESQRQSESGNEGKRGRESVSESEGGSEGERGRGSVGGSEGEIAGERGRSKKELTRAEGCGGFHSRLATWLDLIGQCSRPDQPVSLRRAACLSIEASGLLCRNPGVYSDKDCDSDISSGGEQGLASTCSDKDGDSNMSSGGGQGTASRYSGKGRKAAGCGTLGVVLLDLWLLSLELLEDEDTQVRTSLASSLLTALQLQDTQGQEQVGLAVHARQGPPLSAREGGEQGAVTATVTVTDACTGAGTGAGRGWGAWTGLQPERVMELAFARLVLLFGHRPELTHALASCILHRGKLYGAAATVQGLHSDRPGVTVTGLRSDRPEDTVAGLHSDRPRVTMTGLGTDRPGGAGNAQRSGMPAVHHVNGEAVQDFMQVQEAEERIIEEKGTPKDRQGGGPLVSRPVQPVASRALVRRLFDKEMDNHHEERLLFVQLAALHLRRICARSSLGDAVTRWREVFARQLARGAELVTASEHGEQWIGGVTYHEEGFYGVLCPLLGLWALGPHSGQEDDTVTGGVQDTVTGEVQDTVLFHLRHAEESLQGKDVAPQVASLLADVIRCYRQNKSHGGDAQDVSSVLFLLNV